MAYDDKELKIGKDIYRRHEGVLEVLPEEFFGGDWISYGTVDWFDDLIPCFASFNKEFEDVNRGVHFRPKYTGEEWNKLFELAIHEQVILPNRFYNIPIPFIIVRREAIIISEENGIYIPQNNCCIDKPNNFIELWNEYERNLDLEGHHFLNLAESFFSEEFEQFSNQKLFLLKQNKDKVISGLGENDKERILTNNSLIYGVSSLDNVFSSDLFQEWFDEDYIPITIVKILAGIITIQYKWFGNIIIRIFNNDFVINNFHNEPLFLSKLEKKAFEISEGLGLIVSSNLNLIKKGISILIEKNWQGLLKSYDNFNIKYYSSYNDIGTDFHGNTKYFLSDEEMKCGSLETNLKKLNLKCSHIFSLTMKCKIKNLKPPILDKDEYPPRYIQNCIVYDNNTNKTIKATLSDSVADFDKWENVTDVEIYGSYDLDSQRPLYIEDMKPIETTTFSNNVLNRNQETPGYDEWKDQVIKRDKVCQCCGLNKHQQVHHMFGYKEHPELATDINNGVVLCKFCHDKYHSIYGLKNINPKDLIEFIKNFGVIR